jgi:UDP-glucose 4-epimerase
MTRIAVTGAGGFLGRHVVAALGQTGAEVSALLGPPQSADICDAEAIHSFVEGADAVVHLAGPPSVAESFRDPLTHVRVHAQGTATLLEACRARGVRRLVYVSSAEVYGQPLRTPVAEDHRLSARSPYAAAKICAEKLIESYAVAHGLRAIVLRPFSIFGPGASPDSLISRIAAFARAGKPVALRDLRPVRDYCFVTDVADAVVRACAVETHALEVLNVGTMRGATVGEVAKLLLAAMGSEACIEQAPERDRPAGSDIHELIADNRRAKDILRWAPAVSLEEGLRKVASAA